MIPEKLEADWLAHPDVQAIFAALDGAEGKTRAVGGVVRDSLMGRLRPDSDIDMATELLPVTVMQKAKAAGIATYPTGIDHGTVTLKLNDTLAEVTTLRQDVKTDGRHAEVLFGTDWFADAQRRDFTLNALYCHADGTLFDPLDGAGDAINSRVRFIGDAATRIAEDGLRVFRFFRFCASHAGQSFDPAGLAACRDAVGKLDHISAERIGAEMVRMLALPQVAATLGVMSEIGLVPIPREALMALLRYEQLGGQNAASRLALISDDLPSRQKQWRLSSAIIDQAGRITGAADLLSQDQINWAVYRFGEDAIEGLAIAAAKHEWPRARLAEMAREMGRLPASALPVGGKDLLALGYKAGPEMGATLTRLEALWVDSGFTLDPAQLLAAL